MLRINKQHAWVVYELGEKVQFKKNPTFVDVLWVENCNLATKASGVVESERSNVTGWLVRPVGSPSNRYVVSDEEMRKRYKPYADEDRLQKYGEDYFWDVAKQQEWTFVSVPQHRQVVFVTQDVVFPDPWEGIDFTLLAGGVLVDNGNSSVYGINPVEFWDTHERVSE